MKELLRVFWPLIGLVVFVIAGVWYSRLHPQEPQHSGLVKPIQQYTVFGSREVFAQEPAAPDTVWIVNSGTVEFLPAPTTTAPKEEPVDMDMRYIRRLLVELIEYLPGNEAPGIRSVTSEYRPPPTPAQELHQQAEELERKAQRLEAAERLRHQVEQAIGYLDTVSADSGAGK